MIFLTKILLIIQLFTSQMNIIAIGHSWAEGTFTDKYISEIQKENINIELKAKTGALISWGRLQLVRVDSGKYDGIVLFLGVNDYKKPYDWFEVKYNELINISLAKCNKVYVYNIPRYYNCEKKIIQINEYLNTLNNDSTIIILDVWSEYKNSNTLHPLSYYKCQQLLKNKITK